MDRFELRIDPQILHAKQILWNCFTVEFYFAEAFSSTKEGSDPLKF